LIANDPATWAERLYERLPEVYRTRDLDTGEPLRAIVRAIATQVSGLRLDMDDLWDDFFIETCDDWAVPYIGALFGTRLLANPIGQNNRLDVRNTILWRRSKGTPAMLGDLARATTGWRVDVAEFFHNLAWVQNLNHLRGERRYTVATRDRLALAGLGHPADPFAHNVDLRRGTDLDAPPAGLDSLRAAAGTPGRYSAKRLGFFVRRLETFRTQMATPAPLAGSPRGYTFDPLGRETPLFSQASGAPIGRTELADSAGAYFGDGLDIAVRRNGLPLATTTPTAVNFSASDQPFKFGDTSEAALDPAIGMRLMEPSDFAAGGEHFTITALWRSPAGDTELGRLLTLQARLGDQAAAFTATLGTTDMAGGQLVIRIETGPGDTATGRLPAGPGRFPATVIALRDRQAIPRAALDENKRPRPLSAYQDALLVYLPGAVVAPDANPPLELLVADDGSTTTVPGAVPARVRSSEGQVWPPADLTRPSPVPLHLSLHRRTGLRVADPSRIADLALLEAYLFTGVPQLVGAVVTQNLPVTSFPADPGDALYTGPEPVRGDAPLTELTAFAYYPSQAAVTDALPVTGQLLLRVRKAATGPVSVWPQTEVVLTDRGGAGLLAFLPEVTLSDALPDSWFFVAEDGSTYRAPTTGGKVDGLTDPEQLPDTTVARVAAGQVMPLEGEFPLRRRQLAELGRTSGRLWIDPQRGIFCLPANDPLLALSADARDLAVDYVEAFPDRVGARGFDRAINYAAQPPTRIVAASGDSAQQVPFWRIHMTLAAAVAAAVDRDVIEFADSATYAGGLNLDLKSKSLTIRAANQPYFERPCLQVGSTGLAITAQPPGDRPHPEQPVALELNGLLIGGHIEVAHVDSLSLLACTLDPGMGRLGPLLGTGDGKATYLVCRCLTGPLRLAGVATLTVADSIVGNRGELAIGGPASADSPSAGDPPALEVHLERVSVLGRLRSETLNASECLLGDLAVVDDRQLGCVRFSRFEPGSVLPQRYRCVPTDAEIAAGQPARPVFRSLRTGAPWFGQLGATGSPLLVNASEAGDEVGAFAHSYPGLRLANLRAKLQEFLPVGLEPLVVAET
jgi:hypothetical protein